MDRGIQLVIWDWQERSKQWLFVNGFTLKQDDGSLIVPQKWKKWPGILSQQYKRPKKEHSRLTGRTMS
jgi:hypothetical protein